MSDVRVGGCRRSRRRCRCSRAYFLLAALYAWQASRRETPTLFSDEIEFTQISRSIAETGRRGPARRRARRRASSLYAYLAAPAWWLDDVETAYERGQADRRARDDRRDLPRLRARPARRLAAVRALRRRRHGRGARALVLAVPRRGAARLPGLDARALPDRTAPAIAPTGVVGRARARRVASSASLVRDAARGPPRRCSAIVLLARAWQTRRAAPLARDAGPRGDWVGAAVLGVGVAVVLAAAIGRRSTTWYVATALLQGPDARVRALGAGALAIGVGVLPVIAALAALVAAARRGARHGAARRSSALTSPRRRLRPVHRGQGRVPLDDVRDRRRGAEPDLPRPRSSSPATALLLERRRAALVRARGGGARSSLYLVTTTPYTLDAVPQLRGARPRDRGVREPDPPLAGRRRSRRRSSCSRSSSASAIAALRLVRTPRCATAGGRRARGRFVARLER